MKRQNFKSPIVISGIFFCTILAAVAGMYQMVSPAPQWRKLINVGRSVQVQPATGHWLRTAGDAWYKPPSLELGLPRRPISAGLQKSISTITLEEARTRLNKQTDAINILYVWTDNDRLRVISITSFNKKTKHAAVVVIPLYTVINNSSVVNPENRYLTLQELYRAKGREGLKKYIEEQFEIKIPNFVHVNQTALKKISDIVGQLNVNGDDITMLEAFEQTEAGIRTDDRDVVRAVADQILKPRMLLEVPKLLWIFTHDIATNFSTQQMVNLFNFSRQMDLANMRKTALPGQEYNSGSGKYLFVSEHTWKNLFYDITR